MNTPDYDFESEQHVYVEQLDEEFTVNFYFKYSKGFAQTRDTPEDPGEMEHVLTTADALPAFPARDLAMLLDFTRDVENLLDAAEADAWEQLDSRRGMYAED